MAEIDIKNSSSNSLPNYIKDHLTKEERVVYSGLRLTIDGEKDFNFAVTNKRIIFAKKRKMHDVRHDHISSISWERRHRWWLILVGVILVAIGGYLLFDNLRGYGGWMLLGYEWEMLLGYGGKMLLPGGIIVVGGVFLILSAFFRAREFLSIYSSGRKIKIEGEREVLEKLMKIALEMGNK